MAVSKCACTRLRWQVKWGPYKVPSPDDNLLSTEFSKTWEKIKYNFKRHHNNKQSISNKLGVVLGFLMLHIIKEIKGNYTYKQSAWYINFCTLRLHGSMIGFPVSNLVLLTRDSTWRKWLSAECGRRSPCSSLWSVNKASEKSPKSVSTRT